MDIQTWSAAATIVGTVVGAAYIMVRVLLKKFEQLEGRIGGVETKLEGRLDKLDAKLDSKVDKAREESRADIAELRTDFRFLSQRIIDFLAHPPERTAPSQGE